MQDRPSQTYLCQNLGCPNGYRSTFSAAPETWFYEKNLLLPKSCPDCKSWINAQRDQALRCTVCNNSTPAPARYKISHHKKIGPYRTPEKCESCEKGVQRRKSAQKLQKQANLVRPGPKKRLDFSRLKVGIQVQPRKIPANIAYYEKLVPDKSESRRRHLEHHMAGSPYSQVGQIIKNRNDPQTRTALVGEEVRDFDLLLAALEMSLSSADPNRMREYQQGKKIVRLTLLGEDQIEVTILRSICNASMYEVITTFDEVSIQKAVNDYN